LTRGGDRATPSSGVRPVRTVGKARSYENAATAGRNVRASSGRRKISGKALALSAQLRGLHLLRRRTQGSAPRADDGRRHAKVEARERATREESEVPSFRCSLELHRPSLPLLPEKRKGQVERPIRYLRVYFIYGRDSLNDPDLNEQRERWLEGQRSPARHHSRGAAPSIRAGVAAPAPSPGQAALPLAGPATAEARCSETSGPAAGPCRAVPSPRSSHQADPLCANQPAQQMPSSCGMRSSRLPAVKLLSEFDFSFQPTVCRVQRESLHELSFVPLPSALVIRGAGQIR
jgi:hypothetical protein